MDDLQLFEIEIWLIEAIEQHQSIRTGFDEPFRKIRNGCDERADLHRQGMVMADFISATNSTCIFSISLDDRSGSVAR